MSGMWQFRLLELHLFTLSWMLSKMWERKEFCFVFFFIVAKRPVIWTPQEWHCSQCHNLHIILLSCTYLLTAGPLPIAHQQTSVQNCGNTGLIGQSVTDCYRFMVLNLWSKVFTLLYNITRLSLQTHFKLGLAITLPFSLFLIWCCVQNANVHSGAWKELVHFI